MGSSFKLRLLVINLASIPGRQLVNSPTAQSLKRKVQARFRLKLWLSFFGFRLLNVGNQINKIITAFWVGHLLFFASRFCYSSCFGGVVAVGQGDFLPLQTVFKFGCSYFF